ncbi:MAG: hypothetical protein KDD43_08880 [Bdellovibrionales bacterium]|nr:hypothetical protein [Bdellovibrionales bacterium]
MGFPSARAFYQHLESRADLEFNYSYYKRFENGQALPSTKVINNIVALLPAHFGEELIMAYCSANFPTHEHLFTTGRIKLPSMAPRPKKPKPGQQTVIVQRTLTERQVGLIAKTQHHYYLFLLLVLSRHPLKYEDLLVHFPEASLQEALEDFKSNKIAFVEGGEIQASYPEFRFPAADGKSVSELYKKLDHYDSERPKFFTMERLKSAEMFRRISPRYMDLILSHLDVLLQTIRMSEDVDSSANSEVISFSLRFHRGKLPG